MSLLETFLHKRRIAYFSMEIALQSDIPTYSGGLGVLAGDTLRSASDLELPLVGITLISRMGYFHQTLDDNGLQIEQPDPWEPEKYAVPLEAKIAVPIEEHQVWVQAWLYIIKERAGYDIPVLLLDTDLTENTPDDRTITHHLYGNGEAYRLKQEIVLGIGGARMLQALGFRVHTYHMNEGHSALLALELLRRYERPIDQVGPNGTIYDVSEVKRQCLFTTHTPVEAGHDQFDYTLVERILDGFIDLAELRLLAGSERLNMTRLALNLSSYVNGVAKSHAKISNSMFPGYRVRAITNGVHPHVWSSRAIAALYDRYIPEWRFEPELLIRADQIPDAELVQAHKEAKIALISRVRESTGKNLDEGKMILGFARRMTAYKRPDLIFSDLDRLCRIAVKHPFQIVIAGKAHPRDESGKRLIMLLHDYIKRLDGKVTIAYLPNYDMDTGKALVSGCDLWLNTPLRPFEASGTSGMKATLNGVPNLSVLDGWWVEGCIEGVTGWAVGSETPEANGHDAEALYQKLENTVLPLFYNNPAEWVRIMKGAITKNAAYFNSHRMMRRYAAEAYIR